ncbi:MAG TPA: hypothetical protein VHD33_02985, partial [Legionellaceae bacterium]|nr:hypothetical protein [Legionellaceae bacterium]
MRSSGKPNARNVNNRRPIARSREIENPSSNAIATETTSGFTSYENVTRRLAEEFKNETSNLECEQLTRQQQRTSMQAQVIELTSVAILDSLANEYSNVMRKMID